MSKIKVRFFILFLFFATYYLLSTIYCLYAQDEFIYNAKGKRNPFFPLVSSGGILTKLDKQERNSSVLTIDGIIYDSNGLSYALVSGSVVGIGDYVGELRVLKIQSDRVVFLKDNQKIEIPLAKEEH